MQKSPRLAFVLAAFLALAVIAASGCGSSATTGAAAAAKKTALTTVTVATASAQPYHTAFWVAKAEGYFADNGLNVKVDELQGGPAVVQGLIGGAVQFGLFSPSTALIAWQKGKPLTIVAGLSVKGINSPLVSTEWLKSKGLTAKSFHALPLRKRLALFKGSTWATDSTGLTTNVIDTLVKAGGLNPATDITLDNIGSGNAPIEYLKLNKVDGIWAGPPYNSTLVTQGYAATVLNPGEMPLISDVLQSQVIVSPGWAASHASITRAFVSAIVRASKLIESPGTVSRVSADLVREFPTYTTAQMTEVVNVMRPLISASATIPPAVVNANIQFGIDVGEISHRPDVTEFYTPKYLPTSG